MQPQNIQHLNLLFPHKASIRTTQKTTVFIARTQNTKYTILSKAIGKISTVTSQISVSPSEMVIRQNNYAHNPAPARGFAPSLI